MADYDEQIDKGVTDLQKNTETFLQHLEAVDGPNLAPYDPNKAFYADTSVAISSLRVRADATQRNSLTVKMLDKLKSNLDRFENMHKEGLNKKELPPLRGGFNSQFTAILTFELAKKRGQPVDDAKAAAPATPIGTQGGN